MESAHRRHEADNASSPAGFEQSRAQLRRGTKRPHAATTFGRASPRVACTMASNSGSSSGTALRDRRSLARHRGLIAAHHRAGQRALAAERGPVLDRGPDERDEQFAVGAGRGGQLLGGGLERDEEVRRHRRGGVVGGAMLIGDLDRPHPEGIGQLPGHTQPSRRGGGDRGSGAGETRSALGGRHQRVQREGLARGEHVDPGCSRAVADEHTGPDVRRGRGDLAIGHAQHDGLGTGAIGAAPERSIDLITRLAQRARQRGPHSAAAHHGQRKATWDVRGRVPFQFPHVRYRSVC